MSLDEAAELPDLLHELANELAEAIEEDDATEVRSIAERLKELSEELIAATD